MTTQSFGKKEVHSPWIIRPEVKIILFSTLFIAERLAQKEQRPVNTEIIIQEQTTNSF
jgi:hypothetical protein